MNFVDGMVQLAQQLVDERSAAHDLWTWLPSYQVAKKHHGDHVSNVCPSVRDVLNEAAMFFSYMNTGAMKHGDAKMTPAEQEWFDRCPCDEGHEASELSAPQQEA